jgi:hypothetical protein
MPRFPDVVALVLNQADMMIKVRLALFREEVDNLEAGEFFHAVTVHSGKRRIDEFDLLCRNVADNDPPLGVGKDMPPPGKIGLALFARRVVAENHHGTGDLARLQNGRADAPHVEGMPVLSQKNRVIASMRRAIAVHRKHRTCLAGGWTAVAPAKWNEVMDEILAQICLGVAKHPLGRNVNKRQPPLLVEAKDPFTRVLQDQLVFVHRFSQGGL